MQKQILGTVLFCFICAFLFDCKRQFEKAQYQTYESFAAMSVGKYITYRLDSTVTKSFGTGFEVHTYTIKDSIESQITDNDNRLSYRIVRYQFDGSQWTPINTFMATPLQNDFEFVENNLRVVKLVNPVVDGKTWMGNNYIGSPPFFANSNFQSWVYAYTNLEQPFVVNMQPFDSTITVVSFDSLKNEPFYKYGYITYAKGYEVYAKKIGKIYQDVLNWEYQPTTTLINCQWIQCKNNICDTTAIDCNTQNCDSISKVAGNSIMGCDTLLTNYFYNGYGVKLTMIDHN